MGGALAATAWRGEGRLRALVKKAPTATAAAGKRKRARQAAQRENRKELGDMLDASAFEIASPPEETEAIQTPARRRVSRRPTAARAVSSRPAIRRLAAEAGDEMRAFA